MPTVIVIIPTYNRGYIAKRAIDRILSQILPDFADTHTNSIFVKNLLKYLIKNDG